MVTGPIGPTGPVGVTGPKGDGSDITVSNGLTKFENDIQLGGDFDTITLSSGTPENHLDIYLGTDEINLSTYRLSENQNGNFIRNQFNFGHNVSSFGFNLSIQNLSLNQEYFGGIGNNINTSLGQSTITLIAGVQGSGLTTQSRSYLEVNVNNIFCDTDEFIVNRSSGLDPIQYLRFTTTQSQIYQLSGIGSRMVVTDSSGNLSTQDIPVNITPTLNTVLNIGNTSSDSIILSRGYYNSVELNTGDDSAVQHVFVSKSDNIYNRVGLDNYGLVVNTSNSANGKSAYLYVSTSEDSFVQMYANNGIVIGTNATASRTAILKTDFITSNVGRAFQFPDESGTLATQTYVTTEMANTLKYKSGFIPASDFNLLDGEYISVVDFNESFSDDQYSITTTCRGDVRFLTITDNTDSRFLVTTNSDIPLTDGVYWNAIYYGES